jgi:hypothetical protein
MKTPDFIPKNKTIEKKKKKKERKKEAFFEFSPWQRPHRIC